MPLIIVAVVAALAGIGLALTINNVYEVSDAVLYGGSLPGGAPGDSGSGGSGIGGLFSSIGLLVVIAVAVFLYLTFKK